MALQNVTSNAKIVFFFLGGGILAFVLVSFSVEITKNVCFAYWASFILTESAKNYVLNIIN